MSFGNVIALSNGTTIPQIGLGTWQSEPHEVENAVYHAVKHGYRHLDLAMIYANQDEVGVALKKLFSEGVVKREDLFITSKVWNTSHQPHNVEKELNETLKQLGIPYLDQYRTSLINFGQSLSVCQSFIGPSRSSLAMLSSRRIPQKKAKSLSI